MKPDILLRAVVVKRFDCKAMTQFKLELHFLNSVTSLSTNKLQVFKEVKSLKVFEKLLTEGY